MLNTIGVLEELGIAPYLGQSDYVGTFRCAYVVNTHVLAALAKGEVEGFVTLLEEVKVKAANELDSKIEQLRLAACQK